MAVDDIIIRNAYANVSHNEFIIFLCKICMKAIKLFCNFHASMIIISVIPVTPRHPWDISSGTWKYSFSHITDDVTLQRYRVILFSRYVNVTLHYIFQQMRALRDCPSIVGENAFAFRLKCQNDGRYLDVDLPVKKNEVKVPRSRNFTWP